MSVVQERNVNLGRVARGVYNHGLALDQACPEIAEMHLSGEDVIKIERGVQIAPAASAMVDKMEVLKTEFPPYGLVRLRNPNRQESPFGQVNIVEDFEPVEVDTSIVDKHPDSVVPNNYHQILGTFAAALNDTMMYSLVSEAQAGNSAILDLPHIVEPKFGDPVLDIDRGVGTGAQVMINVLHTILSQYQHRTGHLPTFREFRRLALGSTDSVLILSSLNRDIAQRMPVFFDADYTEEESFRLFRLDLEKRKLEFVQPYYDEVTSPSNIPWDMGVTTGCPAKVQMKLGKSSPIPILYHQLVDIVA